MSTIPHQVALFTFHHQHNLNEYFNILIRIIYIHIYINLTKTIYVHKANVDVTIIPNYTHEFKEYAIGKIVQKINKQCMSLEYYQLQRESTSTVKFELYDLTIVFDVYLGRLYDHSEGCCNDFSHIVRRLVETYC